MYLTKSVEPEELSSLFAQWGDAPQTHHELDVAHPFLSGDHQMLASNGRRAEICYVMHRGDPNDGLLLHIKTIYPDGAYRLPTGGIHEGEAVFDTLIREVYEETGLTISDETSGGETGQVQVERFLGVVSYRMSHPTLGDCDFATYPFLARMENDALLAPQDPEEQIGGWLWIKPGELVEVADRLETVGEIDSVWADWGRFRAILHRFVAAQLG